MPGRSPLGLRVSASQSNVINPASLPFRELDLDASTLTGAHLSPVALWPDISGNTRDASQPDPAQQPIIVIGAPDHPTMRGVAFLIAPDDDGMHGPLPVGGITLDRGLTMYAWVRVGFDLGPQVVWQDESGGNPQLLANVSGAAPPCAGQEFIGWRDSTCHPLVDLTTGFQSLVWVFTPPNVTGTCEVFRNDISIGSGIWSQVMNVNTGYFIGCNQLVTATFAGTIFRFIWFSQAHSTRIRRGVTRFLNNFWAPSFG